MLGNYKLTESEGRLTLTPQPAKGLGLLVFVFAVNLFTMIFLAMRNAIWFLAMSALIAILTVIMICLQYKESKKRIYPIFELGEKGIREIWEAKSRELGWSDIKLCVSDLIETGTRTLTLYDILIFSSADDPGMADRVKNIIRTSTDARSELSKIENTVCIVLESSKNDGALNRISDYLAKKDIKLGKQK